LLVRLKHGEEQIMTKCRRRSLPAKTLLATVAVCASVLCVLAASASAATPTVVMSGLDNPRGLAFGAEGALYVAEAGRGGSGPCAVLRGTIQSCYGATGAVSRLWRGEQERIATGLPSTVRAGEVTGPHDIAMLGRGDAYVTIGWGADPATRPLLAGVGDQFDRLVRLPASGKWRFADDLGAYETEANPDGGPQDSNPYGLLALPGARVLTDAGGNDLLRVDASGDISTLAVFPSRTQGRSTDAVPTSVVVGPDGSYYVGELSGVPFAAGAARVYRVVPGSAPEVFRTGFTTIIDIAFGSDASLYVLEHSTGPTFFALPGDVVRVAPDGTRTTVVSGLTRPTSIAIGDDGALYVTNFGTSVGGGQVLRIEP
jgi:hypothetical protein